MMKTLIFMFLTGLVMTCNKQGITTTCNANTDYTKDADQARKWIVGDWKLVRVTTMIPNPTVDNVVLKFSDTGQISISKDDKLKATHTYQIADVQGNLILKTDAEPTGENWYVRNPMVRICSSELFLDGGIAYDGPGYTFQRIR